MSRKFPVTVTLDTDDLIDDLRRELDHDAIYRFIVGLEKACGEFDLCQRLADYFNKEVGTELDAAKNNYQGDLLKT